MALLLSSKIPQNDVVVSYNKITVLGLPSSIKIDKIFQNFKLRTHRMRSHFKKLSFFPVKEER